MAGVRRTETAEVPTLAIGSAAGLTAADIVFVAQKPIPPTYLLDALAEVTLIGLWVLALSANSQQTNSGEK